MLGYAHLDSAEESAKVAVMCAHEVMRAAQLISIRVVLYRYQIAALNFTCGFHGIRSCGGKGSGGVLLMEMRIEKRYLASHYWCICAYGMYSLGTGMRLHGIFSVYKGFFLRYNLVHKE